VSAGLEVGATVVDVPLVFPVTGAVVTGDEVLEVVDELVNDAGVVEV